MAKIVLNAVPKGFRKRSRTLKSGKVKTHYTISVESEPIIAETDPREFGKITVEAFKAEIEKDFRELGDTVKASTSRARKYGLNGLRAGKTWAKRRYSGGRTGQKEPKLTNQWGTDSGRLSEGLTIRANPKNSEWTINVPANRLKESDFGPNFNQFLADLRTKVKALQPEELVRRPRVQAAMSPAYDTMIAVMNKAQNADAARRLRLRQLQLQLVGSVVKAVL